LSRAGLEESLKEFRVFRIAAFPQPLARRGERWFRLRFCQRRFARELARRRRLR
jgi:hypothetical protein